MTTGAMLRVSAETRDRVMRVAAEDFGGASADDAVRMLLDEHRRNAWVQAADEYFADPANADAYAREAAEFDALDAPIAEEWR